MHSVRQAGTALSKIVSLMVILLIVAGMALSTAVLPGAEPVLAAPPAVSIQRVSVPSTEGNEISLHASISADGRYVAFESYAGNVVVGDTNSMCDIFVRDCQTGEITRVSVGTGNIQSDGNSYNASISADGRYVAFMSYATNLVAGDNNGVYDVFVHDRQTGATTRVSVHTNGTEGDSDSSLPSISADGRFVAFESAAANLVVGDTNNTWDIFVHDRDTGATTMVSVDSGGQQSNDESIECSISADGRYVAFQSYGTNLVAGDNNSMVDIFVHDRLLGETTRVSVDSSGAQGNNDSYRTSISADGRYVAFESYATNLVTGDNNGVHDIFVHDRQTGQTARVSVNSSGIEGNGESDAPARISADGRFVAFQSNATNLVAGDTNGESDIFVRDRLSGKTTRVSVDSDGLQVNGYSTSPCISAEGRFVAFESGAANLVAGDTNGVVDVFVHDRESDETTRVSLGWDGIEGNNDSIYPCISADGRYAAFYSPASNLVANDTNGCYDVFIRDRQTGETTRVSVDSSGAQGNGNSVCPSITEDGQYVAFQSSADNLVTGDTNSMVDIFVHDRYTGETRLVSLASDDSQANLDCYSPKISADGHFVAFMSEATNLVSADNNHSRDIFVRDLQPGGTTVRVSVRSDGAEGSGFSSDPSITADGRYVAFQSNANDLVDGDTGRSDIFVHDRQTGQTTRVSVAPGPSPQADNDSFLPSISADGCYVAFESLATNLVTGDSNGYQDVFVHDRQTGQTTMVSMAFNGTQSDGNSYCPSISVDGQYVAFESAAANLVSGDNNNVYDAFIHDRQTGQTTMVSVASDGTQGDGGAVPDSLCSISADGQHVAFVSQASNLVPDDLNGYQDVFVSSWNNPALACAPASINLGSQYQGSTTNRTLQVRNAGTGTLLYSLSENGAWCSISPGFGYSSGETDNLNVSIDTAGLSPGRYSCVILIYSDGGMGIVPVYLTVLPTPVIVVGPTGHDFGAMAAGSAAEQVFTVSNSGTGDLIIGTVAAADPVAAPFSIVSDNCSGQTIPPGESHTLTVRFSPTAKGSFSDSFNIPSNDPDFPTVTVVLTGSSPNCAPTAPVVDITPNNPSTAADLVCTVTTESTDADGDTVTYTYQWYKDGVLQSDLNTNTVPAAETAKGQVWRCVVTPNDGTVNGSSAEDQVTIGNTAPTAPVASVIPESPDSAADLVCTITTESTDADGDTVTYTYQWYKDGVLQPDLTTNTVPAAKTAKGEVWKCVVTASDGTAGSAPAEAEVTVSGAAGGFPSGAIVGIVIGILAVAGAAAFFWFRRSKKA